MTIAIGMLASDGIVIAADTQVTVGDAKLDQGKWRAISCTDPDLIDGHLHVRDGRVVARNQGSCVVAGAGQPVGHMQGLSGSIIRAFKADQSLVGEELRGAFVDVLSEFQQTHVIPYASLPSEERPLVHLLIGYTRNGRSGLWVSDQAMLTPVGAYHAIGIAQAHATSLLETHYRVPLLTTRAAVALASYVLFKVKSANIYCGNATDVVVIGDRAFQWVHRARAKALDDIWERYARDVDAAAMREFVGEPLRDTRRGPLRRTFNKVMSEVEKDLAVVLRKRPGGVTESPPQSSPPPSRRGRTARTS